jgi:tetratricopeptide (TPR) repeat protein
MARRAILQIGTEKTGTTTLQHFLATNRAALKANGFLYPEFCGRINHTALAAYAMAPDRRDGIRTALGCRSETDVEPMRARLRAAAAEELAGNETVLFCSEHCHSRLIRPAEVETLHALLAPFFDDIRVAVYIRRQDRLALSLYSTKLKSGGHDRSILPPSGPDDPYFNYDRSIGLWEAVFGRDNVHVRLFDRRELVGGDVVADFVATWGLAGRTPYRPVCDQNESIRPLAQEFLCRVNPRLETIEGLPIEDVRGPLAASLSRLLPGLGARPARAEAEAFLGRYRASNEALRLRHFPDRSTLFNEDFTEYPELADPRDFGLDDLATVAAMLHTAATRETRRLEAEIAIRDARIHWLREEGAAAERAIARALEWTPGYPEAYRTLAEHLLRQGRLDEARAAAERAAERRPNAHEYWHFLGILRRRTGDPDGAAEAQRRALELAPDHVGARAELAQALAKPPSAPGAPTIDEAAPCQRPTSA